MTTPSLNQLTLYTNNLINEVDYKDNWQQVIEWLTNGQYDLTVQSVTADTLVANTIGGPNTVYIGSIGGVAGAGVISNGNFEASIAGWATYDNGATAVPIDGTGGVALITFERTTLAPLFGVGSGLVSKPASNCQGNGISYDFTLPLGLTSQTVNIQFYSQSSGAYASGDMGVYIYDITNSTLIYPSTVNIPTGLNQVNAAFSTTVSTSYRIIFHIQTVNASTYTLELDNISLSGIDSASVSVGDIKASSAITSPFGWLPCNGSAVSRATYVNLFSVITENKGTFAVTIAAPAVVTVAGHGLITGDQVSLSTTGALPTGLSANVNYFVVYVDANNFNLATTYSNALAGTKITTTGTQSGVHTLLYNPFGISGASDFLVPDLRAATLRGSGTSTLFTQNNTVNLGGIQNDQIQGHKHSYLETPFGGGATPGFQATGTPSFPVSTGAIASPITDGTNGTPRTGNETLMKNIGVNFFIKY
jgi:microcystin-dependent protein